MRYFLLVVTGLVLSFSFYAQYVLGLQPCPLCLTQRICVIMILICLLCSCVLTNKRRMLTLLQWFFAFAGFAFALRQIWLQSLPQGSAPSCMPGLDVLIRYFPWQDIAHALFWGSGDCAEITWQFLGLSMPVWSMLYFLLMMLASAYCNVLLMRHKR